MTCICFFSFSQQRNIHGPLFWEVESHCYIHVARILSVSHSGFQIISSDPLFFFGASLQVGEDGRFLLHTNKPTTATATRTRTLTTPAPTATATLCPPSWFAFLWIAFSRRPTGSLTSSLCSADHKDQTLHAALRPSFYSRKPVQQTLRLKKNLSISEISNSVSCSNSSEFVHPELNASASRERKWN